MLAGRCMAGSIFPGQIMLVRLTIKLGAACCHCTAHTWQQLTGYLACLLCVPFQQLTVVCCTLMGATRACPIHTIHTPLLLLHFILPHMYLAVCTRAAHHMLPRHAVALDTHACVHICGCGPTCMCAYVHTWPPCSPHHSSMAGVGICRMLRTYWRVRLRATQHICYIAGG